MKSLPDLVLPKVKFFGLSIGFTSVRGIELNKNGQVQSHAEVIFPEEIFKDGVLIHPEVLETSLKKLYETGKFSSPYVAVCFPEAFAYSRGLTLPFIPTHELEEAVSWHAKDLFPFPREDIYFDFKVLEKTDKEYHLSVVAVQKKILDPLISTLIKSGLKPLKFEPDASAIARLLVLKPQSHALVTEVNRTNAYVTLVEGEKALFTTVVAHTPDLATATYVNNINLTLHEILAFYRKKGVITQETIDVVLTGDVATEEWIPHIPFPAKILRTPAQNPAFNKSYAAAFAQIVPPADVFTINLLPAAMQEFYDTERNTLYYRTILIRINIFIGCICAAALMVFVLVMLEKQRVEAQVKRYTQLNASQSANTGGLLQLNAQAKHVVALAPLRITPREKIVSLAGMLGEEIAITQWEYDDGKLLFTLTGIAQTRDSLLSFRDRLEESGKFTKITIPLESLAIPINVRFTMTFITKN